MARIAKGSPFFSTSRLTDINLIGPFVGKCLFLKQNFEQSMAE
jgi:hypothetical protein